MIGLPTFNRTEQGWALQMLPEMAAAADVAEGSVILLHLLPGRAEVEILPPPNEEAKRNVREGIDKFGEAFAAMKRLGD